MNHHILKRVRGEKSQEEMAVILGTTQKQVSLMEAGKIEIPDLMASTISRGVDNVIVDERFSLPYAVHEHFWGKARNRAGALTVSCWIYPSKDKEFANARVELKFEALETLSEDTSSGGGLILDVMGNPRGPDEEPCAMKLGWPETSESVLPEEIRGERKGCDAQRAMCYEYGQNQSRPAHKLAYILSFADHDDVSINLYSANGYRLNDLDTIGFPLYPDFVLERISFEAHFYSLECQPEKPVFTPFLIRRVDERAVPVRLSSGGSKKYADPITGATNESAFTFGAILRPTPGYIYSVSWDKLVARA